MAEGHRQRAEKKIAKIAGIAKTGDCPGNRYS
jgi:hypothetical protein